MSARWSTRGLELLLLVLAQLVTGLGYFAVARTYTPQASWQSLLPVAALTPGWLAVHLLIRRTRRPVDPILLPVVAMLAGVGQIMIFRLDPSLVSRHTFLLGCALLTLAALAAWPNLHLALGRYRYSFMGLGVLLLLGTTALGRTVHGAQLSIDLGLFSFQPSEFVKLLVVAFMAAHLAEKRELLRFTGGGLGMSPRDLRYLGPVLVMWLLSVLLIVSQGDLGAALILYGIFLAMLYLGEDRRTHLVVAALALLVAAWVGYQQVPKVQTRLAVWLNPWADSQGAGYQAVQALLALGYGGLAGAGLGAGFPQDIPAARTDFVFAAFAEEAGMAGALALLALYLVLIWRALRAALRAGDDFAALLAGGLASVLALQTLIITGGICRLLPLTGITLPFISYGGSSLLANAIVVGLLLEVTGGVQAEPGWTRLPVRRLRRLLGLVLLGMFALAGSLWYWQVYRAPGLFAYPYNRRPFHLEARVQRGTISDRAGVVLAETAPEGRRYPLGEVLSPVVGYYSLQYGRVGLERSLDWYLSGLKGLDLQDRLDALLSDRYRGASVRLTLDSRLQQAAYAALAGRRGAVAALRPATGEVLALVSRPSFDPAAVAADFPRLAASRPPVLLDRATQGLYPPGSSFKVVTAAAALDEGVRTNWYYHCTGSLQLGRYTVHCYGNTAHGMVSLSRALVVSCNCAFATLAMQIGQPTLEDKARLLGFDRQWRDFPVPVSTSPLPARYLSRSELAQEGFGQAELVATPLQMALVAAAVANHGLLMQPYLVDRVTSATRGTVEHYAPRPLGLAMSADTAATLTQMMRGVVASGTGTAARLPGWDVAGKTGTAQNPHGLDHAWFICFAPASRPVIALAVVLENAGPGGRAAAPVARRILADYLPRYGH